MKDKLRNGFNGKMRFRYPPVMCMILSLLLVTGLLLNPVEAEAVSKQTYANVIIFAYFEDGNTDDYYNKDELFASPYLSLKDDEFFQDKTVTAALMKMYNGDEEYSMTNYLNKVSDGNFAVKNIFPQYDSASGTITPYCIRDTKLSEVLSDNKDEAIIREIMNNIQLPGGSYDYNNDGCIDNLTVILRGGVEEVNIGKKGSPTMYAHKADYGSTEKWNSTGKRVSAYNMLNTCSVMERAANSQSGVIIHEFLHTLGFPDLYPIESSQYPVGRWDIMGSSAKYPPYVLAYMRMYIGKWMDESEIPVITASQTQLTLDRQDKTDGKRAYIIKSPLNDEEFFVVEFRQKPSEKTIDYYIGGSGIIVYRINTRVENLTNHGADNQYGVYVFRPQSGQFYFEGDDNQASQCAFLSEESGRTEMGTADMSKKLEDGAIAFSSGENSGIVISNVSSSAGDRMTFDVTVPSSADYDVWSDTKFNDTGDKEDINKRVAVKNWNGIPYMAVYRNGRISLWKYADSAWTQTGADISCSYLNSLNLEVFNNELYLSYDEDGSMVTIKKMKQGASGWSAVNKTSGSEHSLRVIAGGLYMAYLKPYGDRGECSAVLAKISENTVTDLKEYQKGFLGTPQLACIDNTIYTSVRNASDAITVYKYENDAMQAVSQNMLTANTYDMVTNVNKLYITLGRSMSDPNSELKLYTYDGSSWESVDSGIGCFQPKLSVSQGNLYILMTPDEKGSIKVIRYDEENRSFVEEGINIDGTPSSIDFTAIGHKLFAAYVRQSDQKIYVKLKESTASDTGHVHTVVKDPEVPATATEDGKTEGSHCSECGTVITGQKVIPRVGTAVLSAAGAYSGKVKTPSVTVKDVEGNVLKPDVDYTVKYQGTRVNVGTYRVSVLLQGRYSGTLNRDFKINPSGTKLSRLKAAKKKVTVTWKKQSKQTTGYQVQYALKSSFAGAKTTTITKNSVTKKVVKKLKSGKYYYVRVRTYKKTGGKSYYSYWSSAKKVKIR